jgi:hypothetical protein
MYPISAGLTDVAGDGRVDEELGGNIAESTPAWFELSLQGTSGSGEETGMEATTQNVLRSNTFPPHLRRKSAKNAEENGKNGKM